MQLPRDVSGTSLLMSLRRPGCEAVHRRGSHVRITTQVDGEHHEVVPIRSPIKEETLSSILESVGRHHGMSVDELLQLVGL